MSKDGEAWFFSTRQLCFMDLKLAMTLLKHLKKLGEVAAGCLNFGQVAQKAFEEFAIKTPFRNF